MTEYDEFLRGKRLVAKATGREIGLSELPDGLSDHARAITRWAVRKGCAAVFAGTGLHKSRMQVAWLDALTGPDDYGLIFAPLAVGEQTIEEAAALGITLTWVDEQPNMPGKYISNYEKMHRFDPERFASLGLDESSILKSMDGKTRERLIREWGRVANRSAYTATPAPNDISEIGNHAEFIGVMKRVEMLATFFVHDESSWRMKGHARREFFRWLASWCVYLRQPSDIGYSDEGYELPELRFDERQVEIEHKPDNGQLFPTMAGGITGRSAARRHSVDARVAELAGELKKRDGQWVVWCGLNSEQDAMESLLGDDCISIYGSLKDDEKVRRYRLWRSSGRRILLTKLSMFGFGLNMQQCHQMAFLGLGDSWEQYYQGIRRCWRFGQKSPVDVIIVVSEAEGRVVENVRRKEQEAVQMASEVVAEMGDLERVELGGEMVEDEDYPTSEAEGDNWLVMLGDSCERLSELDENTIDLSVYSPPFASLYTYSDSVRDLGNSTTDEQFFTHYRMIIAALLRATKPGRITAVHVSDVPAMLVRDGYIGLKDFSGDVIRAYIAGGWTFDARIPIDKNQQAQSIRTHSKALTMTQLEKDRSWSRPALPDYILKFRKPGENAVMVKGGDVSRDLWIEWANPTWPAGDRCAQVGAMATWYGIRESETLQAAPARGERDEKHIAPLQLETVERCIRLWSNVGDLVCDPFNGIGTTGYVALQHKRRYVGIELKLEYFRQAVKNLREAEILARSPGLFDALV